LRILGVIMIQYALMCGILSRHQTRHGDVLDVQKAVVWDVPQRRIGPEETPAE